MAVVTVNGLPSGAPLAACLDLVPRHGSFQPSTSFLPYIVNTLSVGQSYIPNQAYRSE